MIIQLENRRIIAILGDEAKAFLQNIFTNDMDILPCHSALLTPQGKILADFFVSSFENGFILDCHANGVETLLKRLSLYKLRAKIEIKPLELKVYVSSTAFEKAFEDPRAKGFFRGYSAPHALKDISLYETWRVQNHLPECFTDYNDSDVFPHEANMDKTHSVSFKKGCYVGQEVVSRMQHKTEIRKRFIGYSSDVPIPPFTHVMNGERQIGITGSQGLMLARLDLLEGELTANGVKLNAQP